MLTLQRNVSQDYAAVNVYPCILTFVLKSHLFVGKFLIVDLTVASSFFPMMTGCHRVAIETIKMGWNQTKNDIYHLGPTFGTDFRIKLSDKSVRKIYNCIINKIYEDTTNSGILQIRVSD